MGIKIECKLDILKLQYAVLKAEWDEITADEHTAENAMEKVGERLLEAEDALRDEFLGIASKDITAAELKLLESVAYNDKFFQIIMK